MNSSELCEKELELKNQFDRDIEVLRMQWLNENGHNKIGKLLMQEDTGDKFKADKVFISIMPPCYGGYISVRFCGQKIGKNGIEIKSRGGRTVLKEYLPS